MAVDGGAPGVKLAVTSSSFAALLRRRALTHLEWLEACASRLDVDGVVFDLADLPRTDLEYAAQVKKVATDLGIVPVALDVPGLLDPDRPAGDRAAALTLATGLGVGLIRLTEGPPGPLPPKPSPGQLRRPRNWPPGAKAANLTLTLAPAAGLPCWPTWPTSGNSPNTSTARGCATICRPRAPTVRCSVRGSASWSSGSASTDAQPFAPLLRARVGFVLEGDGGDDPFARVAAAVAALRAAGERGQRPQMPSIVPG